MERIDNDCVSSYCDTICYSGEVNKNKFRQTQGSNEYEEEEQITGCTAGCIFKDILCRLKVLHLQREIKISTEH